MFRWKEILTEFEDLNNKVDYLIVKVREKEEEILSNRRVLDLTKNLSAANKDAIRLKNADDANKKKIQKINLSRNFLKDDMNYYKGQAKNNLKLKNTFKSKVNGLEKENRDFKERVRKLEQELKKTQQELEEK